jgi:hypothetical protein
VADLGFRVQNDPIIGNLKRLMKQGVENAEKHFRDVATEAARQYKVEEIDITVTVDGRVSDPAATRFAQREVILTNEAQTISLAVRRAEALLKDMIRRHTNTQSGSLVWSVSSFLFRDGSQRPLDVTGSTVDDLGPGDMVMVMPTAPYYPMVNSSVAQATKYGYMRRAAMRVRREFNITTRRKSNLRVFVGRDTKIASMVPVHRGRGIRKPPFPTETRGLPAIFIRYKRGGRY